MNPLILSREETAVPLSGGNWLVLSTAGGGHDDEAGAAAVTFALRIVKEEGDVFEEGLFF